MRPHPGPALLFCLAACAGELPSPSRVDALRVIALTTETPEIRPGTAVTVRALWFDPRGRPARFAWSWCWEGPGIDPLRCADGEGARTLASTGEEAELDAAALRDRPPDADVAIVVVRASLDGDRAEAFRRVRVRDQGALNQVPEVRALIVDDGRARVVVGEGDVTEIAARAARVELVATEASRETDAAGVTEVLTASFLASEGSFDPPRVVGAGPFIARWRGVEGGEVRCWAVLRDDRGGVRARAWTLRAPR